MWCQQRPFPENNGFLDEVLAEHLEPAYHIPDNLLLPGVVVRDDQDRPIAAVDYILGVVVGGLNGTNVLNSTTVHSTGPDDLFGTVSPAAHNWFFFHLATQVNQQNQQGDIFTPV